MYLESALVDPEYVRFKWDMIPPRIREYYKLDQYVVNGFVYALIAMAWYGLKQSGKIAHDDLVAHLVKEIQESKIYPRIILPCDTGHFIYPCRG